MLHYPLDPAGAGQGLRPHLHETRAFLATLPNRFEFTFTPVGEIRVASADELKARIELYVKEVNETPGGVLKHKLEALSLV
jgi:hypothetical protein